VSSEDQRERETIRTQTDELARWLAGEPDVELVERFVDDGVSGTIPLAERPAGSRLMHGAATRQFEEVHVYKFDRLGRDAVDLLVVRRRFMDLGIRVRSIVEGEPDLLGYDVQAVVADHARRDFLRRSADGLGRAAREGRYTGGIVPFGYRVLGRKATARLVPDETIVWADQTAAGLVRWLYERLGLDGWSCRRIAADLNARAVPTHYARDGRGIRGQRTQGLWRAGRIRNMVINPIYRGEQQYGRRIDQRGPHSEKRGHEIIGAKVEPLVSEDLWDAAQKTLAANRTMAKNSRRRYLLRGVIRCGVCGLTYCGTQGRGEVGWYRCVGQVVERGPFPGRCPGQSIRTDTIEPVVWADIERFLRDPGDVLGDLEAERSPDSARAIVEAEVITIARALETLDEQRKRVLNLNIRGHLADSELDAELDRIAREKGDLEARVAAMDASGGEDVPERAVDLLSDIRARLDEGLTDEQHQEIVRLLAKITIHTEPATEGRRKLACAVIEYRFPSPIVAVKTRTPTDSWPQPAESVQETRSPGRPGRSRPARPRAAGAGPPIRRG